MVIQSVNELCFNNENGTHRLCDEKKYYNKLANYLT